MGTGDTHVPTIGQIMECLATLGVEVTIFFNMGCWNLFLMLQCFYAPPTVLTSVVYKQATSQDCTTILETKYKL